MSITTQNGLARALGVAKSTLSELVRKPDWPVAPRPPWSPTDVAAIAAWRSQNQEDRSGKAAPVAPAAPGSPAPAPSRQDADRLLKLHRARYAKVQADLAEARVIPRDIADAALIALGLLFRQLFDEVREALPHELDGDPAKNDPIVRRRMDDALARLAAAESLQLDLMTQQELAARLDTRRKSKS